MIPKIKKVKQTLILILTVSLFTSCDFISNSFTYKDTTKGFVEALIEKDYEKSLTFMATENKAFKNTNLDTLKLGLENFHDVVVTNFGKKLDYTFVSAEKTFSTIAEERTAPNTTLVQIEFSNDTEFGIFELIFDDNSNKILYIKTLDIKEKIPSMTLFWLFGIVAISVPIFNIWIIRKIKKSDLKRKWLKYIEVMFFNVPSLTYSAIYGLSFELLSFQVLFGASFSYVGYLSSIWTFGIPLGGLYWLWKLNKKQKKEEITTE